MAYQVKQARKGELMGKEWKDMNRTEKRIVIVIAMMIGALLAFWFLPRS